jgi:hypothetical protein
VLLVEDTSNVGLDTPFDKICDRQGIGEEVMDVGGTEAHEKNDEMSHWIAYGCHTVSLRR